MYEAAIAGITCFPLKVYKFKNSSYATDVRKYVVIAKINVEFKREYGTAQLQVSTCKLLMTYA